MNLKREVQKAIANEEFKLYYQPIIDLATNEIAGQEALIRWHHPIDILRMPIDFIPQCEADPSIMIEICEFVVRQSCRDRTKLQGDFVSINVSPKSLEQQRFWDVLNSQELVSHIPSLFLEITERSLTKHQIIAPYFIKSSGIGAAIDDFGVEHSGFIQVAKVLALFPSPDYVKVKLDIEFARNLTDRNYRWFAESIVASMTNCPCGKIEVIAEGIEYDWQRDWFLEYGVKYGQGWFWGKAKAVD